MLPRLFKGAALPLGCRSAAGCSQVGPRRAGCDVQDVESTGSGPHRPIRLLILVGAHAGRQLCKLLPSLFGLPELHRCFRQRSLAHQIARDRRRAAPLCKGSSRRQAAMPPRKRKHAPVIADPELSGGSDDEVRRLGL